MSDVFLYKEKMCVCGRAKQESYENQYECILPSGLLCKSVEMKSIL